MRRESPDSLMASPKKWDPLCLILLKTKSQNFTTSNSKYSAVGIASCVLRKF